MSIYVIHRTNYANPALHIVLTKKSVMTSSYVDKPYFYLPPCSDISVIDLPWFISSGLEMLVGCVNSRGVKVWSHDIIIRK